MQWAGLAVVLLVICAGAVGLVLAVFVAPFRLVDRLHRRRIPRSQTSRAARDAHAAAVRDYCLISPDYALAISLLHEGELTDLLGLAVQLRTNDRQNDEDDYADL